MSRCLSPGTFATGLLVAILPALVCATAPLSEFNIPNADLSPSAGLSAATVTLVDVLGTFTDQWLGVLVSFGVIGFATAFALQQSTLSSIG